MEFKYTFIDGVEVPLRIVFSHRIDDEGILVKATVVAQDNFVHTPTEVPLDRTDAMEIPELMAAIFRLLEGLTSKSFLANPIGGIAARFPKTVNQ